MARLPSLHPRQFASLAALLSVGQAPRTPPGRFDLSCRAVPLAASRRRGCPRCSEPVLFLYGLSAGGLPAVDVGCPHVWPHPVHYKHRGNVDAANVDIHVREQADVWSSRVKGSEQ